MSNVYKRRDGYWGLIPIPQEYLLELFSGRMTIDSPKEVTVHSIYHNSQTMSLDIIVHSDSKIEGVTHECYEGEVVPRSDMSYKMDNNLILGSK